MDNRLQEALEKNMSYEEAFPILEKVTEGMSFVEAELACTKYKAAIAQAKMEGIEEELESLTSYTQDLEQQLGVENTITLKEKTFQDALHIVAEHFAEKLIDFRKDFAEDESDEQLRQMIARTDLTLSELEFEIIWMD